VIETDRLLRRREQQFSELVADRGHVSDTRDSVFVCLSKAELSTETGRGIDASSKQDEDVKSA